MGLPKTLQSERSYLHALTNAILNKYQFAEFTPAISTAVHAAGDVLFPPEEVDDVVLEPGAAFLLDSVVLIDDDEESAETDLIFMKSSVSIGAANAAYNYPAGNIDDYLGLLKIPASAYVDHGDFTAAELKDIGMVLRTAEDAESIFVAGVTRGTPTYGANTDIKVKLGFKRY